MQEHGQQEMFMGHNQVGWSSNPGKCGSARFVTWFQPGLLGQFRWTRGFMRRRRAARSVVLETRSV